MHGITNTVIKYLGLFCLILTKYGFSCQIFVEVYNIKFKEICPVGTVPIHVDRHTGRSMNGQTGGNVEVTGVFCDYMQMYLKPIEFIEILHFICMSLKNHTRYRIFIVRLGISAWKGYVSHQMSPRKQKEIVKLCHPVPSPIKLFCNSM